jgi:glutaredoxin
MKLLLMVAAILIAMPAVQADGLYRWVDKEGKMHYGDIPPSDAEEVEELKFGSQSASSVDDASLPYEARRAKEHFPVTLYTTVECGDPCGQARTFLNKRRVPFSEKVLKTKEEYDEFKKATGSQGYPTLSVGKTWLRGFNAGQWGNELDAAGYPK